MSVKDMLAIMLTARSAVLFAEAERLAVSNDREALRMLSGQLHEHSADLAGGVGPHACPDGAVPDIRGSELSASAEIEMSSMWDSGTRATAFGRIRYRAARREGGARAVHQ